LIDQERALPTGTVTFMFTDVEGSTNLVHRLGDDAFARLLRRHHELIREVLQRHHGTEVATEGDAFFAAFSDVPEAVSAATDLQRALAAEDWGEGIEVAVRVGLHTGNASLGGDNYTGVDVHRASRIAEAAHGGQVILSAVTARLAGGRLPFGVSLIDLGRVRLPDLPEPESLSQLCIAGLPQWFPPLRAAGSRSNLPTHLTDFVGREQELEHGASLLRAHRLVTLTGPGGTGKTRLSVELARRVEPDFEDGCHFVPLATIQDVDLIPTTILGVLGLTTAANVDPIEHLVRYLTDRRMLLVLDNFEQLIEGAHLVADVLGQAPELKLLVTSRAPLRIMGERDFPVLPLPVPTGPEVNFEEIDRWAGVQLFARRAAAVRPDFELSPGNVAIVTSIAARLDGLPLAIELAASRMRSLTPELILQRLDNRLLTSTGSDLPIRQQTIVDAIGWSYDLLSEPTRRLFECCSVFAGSFALTDAETVCRLEDEGIEVLDGLMALVENSLLQQTETSGEPRFRMLTVIREYGYAALTARGREAEMQQRHAFAYLGVAEAARAELLTGRQGYWLERLTLDHDNMRAAIDWAIANGQTDVAHRLVGSLWRFWLIRGHLLEGRQRTEAALALEGGDPTARAGALTALGGMLYWQGKIEETMEPYSQALALYREWGDEADVSEALYNLSFTYGYAGDYERAEELLQESLEISERIGRKVGVGRAYWGLGNFAGYREDHDGLIEYMLRATEEFQGLDQPFDLGWSLYMSGYGYQKMGETATARRYMLESMEMFAAVSDVSALTLIFELLAVVAVKEGKEALAARLAGAAHQLKADTGVAIGDVSFNEYPDLVAFLDAADEATMALYEEGHQLGLEEVIALAREG
jgi:predicted ATPase/class 3 adenylate cyclase